MESREGESARRDYLLDRRAVGPSQHDTDALAVRNGPDHHVFSGAEDAVASAHDVLERAGVDVRRLPGDRAFHSALVDPILDELARHAATLDWRPLQLPVVSNLGATRLEPGTVPGPDHVRRQTRQPADYQGAVDALRGAGYDTFVELGPDATLSRLGRSWPRSTWIPLRRRGDRPVVGALGALYCRGVDLDWGALAGGGRRVPLPTYPFQLRRHWIDPPDHQPNGAPIDQPPISTEGPAAMPAAETGDALTTAVCQRVRELTARQLGADLDAVAPDRDFLDLGADSLLVINLLRELQAIFGVRVTMRELFEEADTPAAVSALIAERIDPAKAAELTGISSTTYALEYGERSYTAWRPEMAPIKIAMCVGITLMPPQAIAVASPFFASTTAWYQSLGTPVSTYHGSSEMKVMTRIASSRRNPSLHPPG